jgi:hypothetical protein
MKEIKLWVKAKDVVTWFIWIVTSITKYLTWCDRVALTPESKKWEIKEWCCFDINSVKYVDEWVAKHFDVKETKEKPKTWWPEVYKHRRIY